VFGLRGCGEESVKGGFLYVSGCGAGTEYIDCWWVL